MGTDYGGHAAYGAQAWQGAQPGSTAQPGGAGQPGLGGQPGYVVGSAGPAGRRRGRTRAGRAAAITMLVLGVAGLGVSLAGVGMQILPRQFTPHQQRQITDWEVAARWREKAAGTIFPASVQYPAPSVLNGSLTLTARRIGIARQASCKAATDAAAAVVLDRNGCQAVLRATYADGTDSYVVTVGVAAFGDTAQASTAHQQLALSAPADSAGTGKLAPGVRTVPFHGTPATWFTNRLRQVSASQSAGTYVVFYTVGYADNRPRLAVASDSYTYSEMLSLGQGVTAAVVTELAAPPRQPHCPGTPGC